MRISRYFLPTERETPRDAALSSHKYLLRGGFISMLSAGIYDYLPLGKRVLDKIRSIVKDELDKAGCLEVSLGFVTPSELWQESGRYRKYGKELLRLKDRKEGNFVLGPTHEEVMVNLVRGRIGSYKQLPINLYQINLKFRDEARPRFGLLRGREFVMKDGYSFHATEEDMLREFHLMEEVYKRIFRRVGLDFRVVEADSGAIGGSGSKEFVVLTDAGEDTIVCCEACEYGANIEAAKRAKPVYEEAASAFNGLIETPEIKTIEELSGLLNLPKHKFIKAVAKKAIYDRGEKVCLFFLRGSDDLEETKALNSVSANELVDLSEDDLKRLGIAAGYIGIDFPPTPEVLCVVDNELKNEVDMIGGANRDGLHIGGVEVGENHVFADLIAVREGDICPRCGRRLAYRSGIEVGHIFQLGTRYSEPLNARFLDENGRTRPFIMGTYGIGVSRLIAAAVEFSHDEKGCVWKESIAPFLVYLIASNVREETQKSAAEAIYSQLLHEKIETIYDDRMAGFGAKMNDFELIGIPFGLIVGKNIEQGYVEIVIRKSAEKIKVGVKEAVDWIKNQMGKEEQ
ncbi:MAG: proline--tRNA ligase [Helicobacteraceae bacterium]|jgi:prolyl-tRNA synthetase|nr:proline--tRNA ligase [Helicobacteraceae bacterium]